MDSKTAADAVKVKLDYCSPRNVKETLTSVELQNGFVCSFVRERNVGHLWVLVNSVVNLQKQQKDNWLNAYKWVKTNMMNSAKKYKSINKNLFI